MSYWKRREFHAYRAPAKRTVAPHAQQKNQYQARKSGHAYSHGTITVATVDSQYRWSPTQHGVLNLTATVQIPYFQHPPPPPSYYPVMWAVGPNGHCTFTTDSADYECQVRLLIGFLVLRQFLLFTVKVKASNTRYRELVPELIPVYRQSDRRCKSFTRR